jgi:hypothetical protein
LAPKCGLRAVIVAGDIPGQRDRHRSVRRRQWSDDFDQRAGDASIISAGATSAAAVNQRSECVGLPISHPFGPVDNGDKTLARFVIRKNRIKVDSRMACA